ncbi:acido-empty-quinoprotein group A [Edaphobacter sp. 12200R-103]|jgi:alcohol dehydrogenase (cytochrome c)|uniref:acido-empty-quinoprotein group A n=1 Tax=Edaphobacter sp. 12200R-103 TaxID=2703788 RepID=UPI00138BEE4D|nr:acido-empty-quinoprotein group A [Edaphobacter sp. 12200R-103]QHS50834.1 acido-empty-quinoprotein group A [Edaphobacter sp. 12200R-103]
MKTLLSSLLAASFALAASPARTQSLDPGQILKPSPDSWPTYSGDYSGRRYSSLDAINQSTVKNLSLAWVSRLHTGSQSLPTEPPTIVAGEGTAEFNTPANIKGSILQVDGVLYVSTPDNAWALDARDGHMLWHYYWKTKGGTHIGNRGMAMWKNWVYMETPDNYLICLDAKTGKEKWHKEIASFDEQYFSTMAPIVVGNHLLVGTGDDLDEPGFLQSYDPETGDVQWRFYTVPMKQGDPGLDTWLNLDAASHGGGNVWVPGSYDPETHLYIFGTGNPSAAYTSQKRGPGSNLYTCSIIALNVDTGKMAWYYQNSPHDTHDYDSAQTPILIDGMFNGKMRKMVLNAARNGYYFTLDRLTGEHLVTGKMSKTVNWARDTYDKNGAPVRIPAKDFDLAGALVSPANQGITNWMPPAYSPDTGLMYVQTTDTYAMYYLTTTDPRGSMGLGGKDEQSLGSMGSYITAIDYKTGKVAWQHRYSGIANYGVQPGLLATAGKLLFTGDPGGNLVAYDVANGNPLWHARIGVSNAPETYMLDGHQYILAGAGDSVYAFRLN